MSEFQFPSTPCSPDDFLLAIEQYLERISPSWRASQPADHRSLSALQVNHLYNIPFENLDVVRDEPIELELSALHEKIVTRGRGGFCYELNSLFGWLLENLGYDVRLVEGRVRDESGDFGPPFDHMALLVTLDHTYLVDVGFGEFARRPLPLSGEPRTDVGGTYRVRPSDSSSDRYEAQRKEDNEWMTAYEFTTVTRHLHEFEEMCVFQQTSPESNFTGRLLVTIATPDGRVTLSDSKLTVTEHGEKQTTELASTEHRNVVLEEQFSIHSSERRIE